MPSFTLNADFDRNGRVTAQPDERAARNTGPGAILVPNLDNDSRALPGSVSVSPPARLDGSQPSKTATDNELVPLSLIPEAGAAPCDGFLIVQAWAPIRYSVLDSQRRTIHRVPGTFGGYPLGALSRRTEFFLEGRTLAGSPLDRIPTLNSFLSGGSIDERRLSLLLICSDSAGTELGRDNGTFTISPWLMCRNSDPIQKLFICDVGSNTPSIRDLQAALPDPAVMVIVPNDVCSGDSWLQDQFEAGYCEGPDGARTVVLHFPRLRANVTARTAQQNLAAFVRGHLPSRDIALFDDFWQRSIPVNDTNGRAAGMTFAASAGVLTTLYRVYQLRNLLLYVAGSLLPASPIVNAQGQAVQPDPFPTFVQALRDVRAWTPLVTAALSRAASAAPSGSDRQRLLSSYAADVGARSSAVSSSIALGSSTVNVSAAGWSAELDFDVVNQLHVRLDQMHSSSNYGGNVELGPAVPGAPLGKVVVGNAQFQRSEFLDPDLKRFFLKQQVQPLVEIRTEWLGVGHVDEVVAFVPGTRGDAILLASPLTGLKLVEAALRQYAIGVGGWDRLSLNPSAVSPRTTASGNAPVTRMLRGKKWTHSHQPGSSDVNEPPRTFIRLAVEYMQQGPFAPSGMRYMPGPGADREYDAAISVLEYRWVEHSRLHDPPGAGPDDPSLTTNEYIEQEFQLENLSILGEAFPDVPILRLPVLFDFVPDMEFISTRAFLPDAVNLVVAGNRLLIPKPFGPRMRVTDVITALTWALGELGESNLASGLNAQQVRGFNLVGFSQWFEGPPDTSAALTASEIANIFRDGLPGIEPEERTRRLLRANPNSFSGSNLRTGWQRLVIPEETVDIFELYITLVARSLGLQARFVDSWHYHINHGEIHCGTNTLRRPASGRPRWWTL